MKKLVKNSYFQFLLLALALLLIVPLASLGIIPSSIVVNIATVIIYGIAALGLNILLGFSGLISLGTAGFMGLGAYLSAYFTYQMNLPFEVSLILSILIPTLIGILIGFVSLKIEGLYLAIATLAVAEVFREIFIQFDFFTGGSSGAKAAYPKLFFGLLDLSKQPIVARSVTYCLIVFVLLVILFLSFNLLKGYIGRSFNAMRGSEHAAQAMGINILRYRIIAFAIATAFAALAGVLYVHIIRISYPTTWNMNLSLDMLAIIVIGGFRSLYGTFVGSFVVYGMSEIFLKKIDGISEYAYIIKGVLIILVILFYPGGIMQLFRDIRQKIRQLFKKDKEVIHEPVR